MSIYLVLMSDDNVRNKKTAVLLYTKIILPPFQTTIPIQTLNSHFV
jgi:hypothetical protein